MDHVKPKGAEEFAHLVCVYENLVYACNRCNSIKQNELLLDPCSDAFAAHLEISEDGMIRAFTKEGQDIIDILGLDLTRRTEERRNRLRLLSMHRRDPTNEDVRTLYLASFSIPHDDLPDLAAIAV